LEASRISIKLLSAGKRLVIQGVALIDERDGSSVPVIVSTAGQYRQVHSGDVKIYQVLDTLPKAYIVHHTTVLAQDDAALAAMLDSEFVPQEEAVLAQGQALEETPTSAPQVQVTESAPERVIVKVSIDAPGYLVLSDSWYPGWQATVDGAPATIERANLALRAVYLPEGDHMVTFEYRPANFWWGLALSSISIAALAVALVLSSWSAGKRSIHRGIIGSGIRTEGEK
jgi:hypothetical protein